MDDKQIWECESCGAEKKATKEGAEGGAKAMLRCLECGETTLHTFVDLKENRGVPFSDDQK